MRHPTAADAEAVAALVNAYDAAHGIRDELSADDLSREWIEIDLERDAWLLERDGRLVGYGCVYGRGAELLKTDGYVAPDAVGVGVGTQILRLAEARARERGAARLHNATLHADARGRALLEANGYAYVRSFLTMAIELDDAPPEPAVPAGLRLVALTEADDEAVHAALEEAFLDHWEHVPRSFESWRREREGQDRSLWFAIMDGDEVAAVSVNELDRYGAGLVAILATRRPWRGRGLGQALLLASFAEFRRRGQTRVQLGVDASNPTGAVRLYERVGMRETWRADVYEKHL